jgi:hypothetical protein
MKSRKAVDLKLGENPSPVAFGSYEHNYRPVGIIKTSFEKLEEEERVHRGEQTEPILKKLRKRNQVSFDLGDKN